jgi:ornithine cyclodeaminase
MMACVTLLLSGSDLERSLDTGACTQALREGFLAAPSGITAQRVHTDLPGPGTATVLIPGLVDGIPAYSVKVNAKFPLSRPALRGVVCLHDAGTGELLAVLDSATVTAWRTGLSAALATHVLARPSARAVAVVGAGTQSGVVLRGLAALRGWERLTVCDLDTGRADLFAAQHTVIPASTASTAAGSAGSLAASVADPRDAVRDADIVVLATWSRTPLLDVGDVMPGAHITSLGADEPGKAELTPALLTAGRLFVDDVVLALTAGALGTAALAAGDATGTFGQVLRGAIPGRLTDADITIYTPVGLPWQDLAVAWAAYCHARAAGLGREFDFLT